MPERGRFHRPFICFKAGSCVWSPLATVSFRCLSCALITASAVGPRCTKSHGPPNCLHVIVFIEVDGTEGERGALLRSCSRACDGGVDERRGHAASDRGGL